jgi:hypothetical protein
MPEINKKPDPDLGDSAVANTRISIHPLFLVCHTYLAIEWYTWTPKNDVRSVT